MATHTVLIPLEWVTRPITAAVPPITGVGLAYGSGVPLVDRYSASAAIAFTGAPLVGWAPDFYYATRGQYLNAHCFPPPTNNGFFSGSSDYRSARFKIGSYMRLLPTNLTISSIRFGLGGLWYRRGDPTATDPWGAWALSNTYEYSMDDGATWSATTSGVIFSNGLTEADGSETLSVESATFTTNPATGLAWTWGQAMQQIFRFRFTFTQHANIGFASWHIEAAGARIVYDDAGVAGTVYTDDGSAGDGGLYTGTISGSDASLEIPLSLTCPVALSPGNDSGGIAGCAETQTPGTDSGGSAGCKVSL